MLLHFMRCKVSDEKVFEFVGARAHCIVRKGGQAFRTEQCSGNEENKNWKTLIQSHENERIARMNSVLIKEKHSQVKTDDYKPFCFFYVRTILKIVPTDEFPSLAFQTMELERGVKKSPSISSIENEYNFKLPFEQNVFLFF